MAMTELEKSIVRTIAYFDLLEYPLTSTEVWHWLYKPSQDSGQLPTILEIQEVLESSPSLRKIIGREEAFYHLLGREQIVQQRKRRNLIADHKFIRARRIVKLFRLIPWVRMIAVCGSLALSNTTKESDIDLFIVTKSGRIWSTRLLLVGILKILRLRPTENNTTDKICLTYFVTTDALNLEQAQIASDDIVFTYYTETFLPLYDPNQTYAKFYQANSWYHKVLPNATWPNSCTIAVSNGRVVNVWHRFFNFFSPLLFNSQTEEWFKRYQLKILPVRLKSIANIDSRVIISDNVLKFHDQDNRLEMLAKWLNKVNELLRQVA